MHSLLRPIVLGQLVTLPQQRLRSRRFWCSLLLHKTTGRNYGTNSKTSLNGSLPKTAGTSLSFTFKDLGLLPSTVKSIHKAFPNVKTPTEAQAQFIPAVLNGKDILLKDSTGTGKSLGLVIALLDDIFSKLEMTPGRYARSPQGINSLVIVPHRDLAYQLFYWIQSLVNAAGSEQTKPSLDSIAHVLVRDKNSHLTSGLESQRRQPPYILIATPQAVMEVNKYDPGTLQLSQLSRVIVDEVDYLVETVPRKDPTKSFRGSYDKARRKLLAHPGPTRQLLDIIYEGRKMINQQRRDEPGLAQQRRFENGFRAYPKSPQLILSSATMRTHLSNYLFDESGWLDRDNLVKVKGTKDIKRLDSEAIGTWDVSRDKSVTHSVLVVSSRGIRNIPGAVAPIDNVQENGADHELTPSTLFSSSTSIYPQAFDNRPEERHRNTPSPFNPDAMEAIATAFALDVPSIALLVLPSASSVQRAVDELCEMGINAHGLDLLAGDKGRNYLLSGAGVAEANPTLLVSTLATTRGVDMPRLSHVFLLGIPEGPKVTGRSVDAYLHIAGRVGRFGRGGKVITIVEGEGAGEEEMSQASKMARILKNIGVVPVQIEQFE